VGAGRQKSTIALDRSALFFFFLNLASLRFGKFTKAPFNHPAGNSHISLPLSEFNSHSGVMGCLAILQESDGKNDTDGERRCPAALRRGITVYSMKSSIWLNI
jgi:hypothetical protein